jgi:hypothetical protein
LLTTVVLSKLVTINNIRNKPAQKQRNRNRSLAKYQPSKSMAPQFHTIGGIQRTLATGANRQKPMGMPEYVHCRVDPFTADGKGSIPDGSNNNYVTIDKRVFDTIANGGETSQAYSFNILTTPTFPCSAAVTSSTVPIKVNGITYNVPLTTGTSGLPKQDRSSAPLSIVDLGDGTGQYFPGLSTRDFATSTSARLVSAGYRLVYTGPTNTCAGTITVTPSDSTFQYFNQSTGSANVLNVAGADDSFTAVGSSTGYLSMNGFQAGSYMTRESVTFRPEQGIVFMPRHKTRDFKIQSTQDITLGIVANPIDSSATSGFKNYLYANAQKLDDATFKGGICWYDNDWSGATISVQGVNGDATFRWETIWCMEFNPSAVNNGLSAFTVKQSPTMMNQIAEAQTITSNLPIARPANAAPTLAREPRQRRPRG